jgi:hypothetical protein
MRKLSSMAAAKAARRASESRARKELKTYWRENGFEKMRLSGITYESHQISNIPIQTIHDLLHAESAQRAGENTRARKNKPMDDIRALVSPEVKEVMLNKIYYNQPKIRETRVNEGFEK